MMGEDQPDGSGRDRAAPRVEIFQNHPELADETGPIGSIHTVLTHGMLRRPIAI